MAAGTAVFSGVTKQAGTIYAASMMALRERPILARTVAILSDRTGLAPRRSQRYASVSFAATAEATDPTPEGFDATVLSTLTPDEYVAQVLVSDLRVESDPENYIINVGMELGAAAADHIDANVATNFASLTGGTITKAAGGTITWDDIHAARAILATQNVVGPYVLALHPYQWRHLLTEAQGNGGAGITNAPGFGDTSLAAAFYRTSLFADVTLAISSNVPGGASTAGTAALYAPMAMALDIRRAFRLEPERDASKRATEYNASMVYAHGLWDSVKGVTIIGDAQTPS